MLHRSFCSQSIAVHHLTGPGSKTKRKKKRTTYITSRSFNRELSKRWTAGRLVEDEAFILSDLKMISQDCHSSDIHMHSRMTPR
jgi:hypothetical protein